MIGEVDRVLQLVDGAVTSEGPNEASTKSAPNTVERVEQVAT